MGRERSPEVIEVPDDVDEEFIHAVVIEDDEDASPNGVREIDIIHIYRVTLYPISDLWMFFFFFFWILRGRWIM